MDIPMKADVYCEGDLCGHCSLIILDPVSKDVTHLVVRQRGGFAHTEVLVPFEQVAKTSQDAVYLRCNSDVLHGLEPFIEAHFVEEAWPDEGHYDSAEFMVWPYVTSEHRAVLEEDERIPPGELAIRRGARVEAKDGRAGRVDEFVVQPGSGHITHLVMLEGHVVPALAGTPVGIKAKWPYTLFGKRDVTVPVSQIERIEEDCVYLKLDKRELERLPRVPVKRHRQALGAF